MAKAVSKSVSLALSAFCKVRLWVPEPLAVMTAASSALMLNVPFVTLKVMLAKLWLASCTVMPEMSPATPANRLVVTSAVVTSTAYRRQPGCVQRCPGFAAVGAGQVGECGVVAEPADVAGFKTGDGFAEYEAQRGGFAQLEFGVAGLNGQGWRGVVQRDGGQASDGS